MILNMERAMNTDYRTYYWDECYLFDQVTQHFEKDGYLGAFDLFCIVVWKANRAKSRIAKRLMEHQPGFNDLESAALTLTREIAAAKEPCDKLRVLIEGWGLLIPMASAILAVLYPEVFTVYDYRVCQQLNAFDDLVNKSKFDSIWDEYLKFIERVKEVTPPEIMRLRDKDRWLSGKSYFDDMNREIQNRFSRENPTTS